MITKCIILAGGLGTRLQSVLVDRPKCLAPVGGVPFIERQITLLAQRGIDSFLLSLGHGANQVIDFISNWDTPCKIDYLIEPEQLDTGGAIKFAMNSYGLEEALVINGDTFLTGSLLNMMQPLDSEKEQIRCGLIYLKDRHRYGGVDISRDGLITRFIEKGCLDSGLINAGFYRISIDAFTGIDSTIFSFEKLILPSICQKSRLRGVLLNGKFIDIGVPDDYKLFCDQYKKLI